MGRQFGYVGSKYGAPMGRSSWLTMPDDATKSSIPTEPRSVRLFKVNLDSGGYDDGGAYWGIGEPLWCATDDENYREFVRAPYRCIAQLKMGINGIPNRLLKVRTKEVPGYTVRRSQVYPGYAVATALDDKTLELCPDLDSAVLYAAKLLMKRIAK